MTIHHDLLDQAAHLGTKEPRRPRQASLRRAVSTAYYALFHLLIDGGAKSLSSARPTALRQRIGRAFTHVDMKNVCKQFAQGSSANLDPATEALIVAPLEPELARIADAFRILQEERHRADYDLSAPFERFDVLQKIDLARRAFTDWQAVRQTNNAKVFLAALLFQARWNK